MKTLSYLALSVAALWGFSSCESNDKPTLDTTQDYEFVLNVPPFANQFIDLSTNGKVQFTLSQPNYGLTLAVDYNIEISLSPEFEPIINEPVIDADSIEHIVPGSVVIAPESSNKGVIQINMSDMAGAINEMYGEFDEAAFEVKGAYDGPVYVRANASVGDGPAASATETVSNMVTLSKVLSFASFAPNVPDYMSVPGDGNGWPDTHPVNLIWDGTTVTEEGGYPKFKGFAYISGAFKITDGDWEGEGNWGASETGLVASNGVFSGDLIQNSQTNFNTDDLLDAGLYFITVELEKYKAKDGQVAGTVYLTKITQVGVCGDFNGWNADNPVILTPSAKWDAFTGDAALTSGGWKFVFNTGWAINLGASENEEIEGLWFDGANLVDDASSVTLKLGEYPWSYDVQ